MYKGSSDIHDLNFEKVDVSVLSELLGDSPSLTEAKVKSPVLQRAPADASAYMEARSAASNAKQGAATTNKNLEKIAMGAAACGDYTRLWKVLKQIKKGESKPFSASSYRLLAQSLLNFDPKLRFGVDQIWIVFQYHIRLLPNYRSEEMFAVSLAYVNALATERPVQALKLYSEVLAEFGTLASPTVETAILELELASKLPYLDTLCFYVEKARNLEAQLKNEADKRSAHSRIVLAFIRGLITAKRPETAMKFLLSSVAVTSTDQSSVKLFTEAYRDVVSAFAQEDVQLVEKAIALLSSLPKSISESITQTERYEWILKANSNTTEGRMNDTEAFRTLEAMSLISGVTSNACNSYLAIVSRNAQPSLQKAAVEAQMKSLYEKYGFLPDAGSFRHLLHASNTLEDIMVVFDRACQNGQVDASVYGEFFKKIETLPNSHKISAGSGNIALATLIEQFQQSGLAWTPKLLEGIISALSSHGLQQEAIDIFHASAARGEIRINARCVNAAIKAAQRLRGPYSPIAIKLSKLSEKNLDRTVPHELRTGPELSAISSITHDYLSSPNSALSESLASSLAKNVDLSLNALVGTQPWMTVDARGYDLAVHHSGYRKDLHSKLMSPPHNIVPKLRTYTQLIRSCKRLEAWGDTAFLLQEMLNHYPSSVPNAFIDEILSDIVCKGKMQEIDAFKKMLQPHGIQIPASQEIMRRFQQSL